MEIIGIIILIVIGIAALPYLIGLGIIVGVIYGIYYFWDNIVSTVTHPITLSILGIIVIALISKYFLYNKKRYVLALGIIAGLIYSIYRFWSNIVYVVIHPITLVILGSIILIILPSYYYRNIYHINFKNKKNKLEKISIKHCLPTDS